MPPKTKAKSRIFRSSLEQIIEIAENIRDKIKNCPKHLEAMKKCPFWSFYQPFHQGRINLHDMKKKQKGLEHIFNTFDPVKQVFEIEGKEFKSTAEQLAVIFGLQRIKGVEEDSLRHPTLEILAAQKVFYKTYLKGETMLKKDVIDSLYATAEDVTKPDDFVKLLVLYFCVAVFFTSQGGDKLPKKFLKYIFAMDQVSWPDLIHSYLLEGLKETKKPCKSVKGCAVYTLFWFAEITHFIGKYEGEQGRGKPRFARWNSKVLAEKIANEGMTSLRQDLTGSFIDPLDEGEQSLLTPIEIRQANSERIGEKMVSDRERDEDWESSPDRDAEHLAPVSLSKKRKRMVESRPYEGKGSCNKEPAHLPSSEPMMPAIPNLLTLETRKKENEDDGIHSSVKDFHGKDVHIGSSSSHSELHNTRVESLEVGDIFEESVDATMNTSSSKCSVDDNTSLTGSTSASAQERVEGYEFVDNLKIPEKYEILYKKIYEKYGHMATRKLIKFNDDVLLSFVTSLLKIISAMESVRGEELSAELLERWEREIQDAEALEFNIKWLREGFNRLQNHWRSFEIDGEVESHEQVLNAMQVKYVDLWTRKEELETELSDVKMRMSKTVSKISSERKAIEEKRTLRIKFQTEPVLGVVLSGIYKFQ